MEGRQESPIFITVEEVFGDFRGRRDGLIDALTTDVERFYQQCDPERDNLCLYGLPTGRWEVNVPVEEVPPEIPKPKSGINFSKVRMCKRDWLSLVAMHSDSWLISLAFYFGARFCFDKNERKRLFRMINGLPTVFEVVCEKQEELLSTTQSNGNKTKQSGKMVLERTSVDAEEPLSKATVHLEMRKQEKESKYTIPTDAVEKKIPGVKTILEVGGSIQAANEVAHGDNRHKTSWIIGKLPKKKSEETSTTSTTGVSDPYTAHLTAKIRAELMQEIDEKVDKKVREMMKQLAEKNPDLKVDINETNRLF